MYILVYQTIEKTYNVIHQKKSTWRFFYNSKLGMLKRGYFNPPCNFKQDRIELHLPFKIIAEYKTFKELFNNNFDMFL